MKKAVIIIPTYNEEKNLHDLVDKINQAIKQVNNWEIDILFVDSKSPDKTEVTIKELQKKYPHIFLLSTEKEGLGKAYFRGFNYALEHLAPYVIFEMDADLSHPPEKIPEFLKTIEKGADFVVGSRYIKGGSIPQKWGIERKLFSVLGNLIVRFGFMKLAISDWTGGYRAIKVWVIKNALSKIKKYSGYVFQIALLDNALKSGSVIKEIPFRFADRKHGISKINAIQYISQVFLYVFLNSTFIKFVIVGFIGFFIDFSLSYLFIEKIRSAVWLGTMISTESAIITNFILNNFWSFSHKKIKGGKFSYLWSFLKFNFVSAGSILIQVIGIQLLALIFGRNYWYIYKIFIIAFIVIPYSYILYNKVIWKEK